jgi:predicted Zn finger-like uncharacterized protein
MIVTCNACESSFKVDDRLIKADGSKVRCSKCSSVFVVYPETSGSETGITADDFALEKEEGLGADLDSGEGVDDLTMGAGASDELPDLEDMMDFDEEQSEDAEMTGEASGEMELDLDLDQDADEDEIVAEAQNSEEELDLDLELEGPEEEDEALLGPAETAESALPDLEMDLDDLDQVAETDLDMEGLEPELDLEVDAEEKESPATETADASNGSDELDLSDLEDLVAGDDGPEAEGMADEASDDADLDLADLDDVLDIEEQSASEALDLEEEPAAHEPIPESAAGAGGADELDLSDLDGLMDSDETAAAAVDEDLELDFEVDEGAKKKEPVESAEMSDQLEMSDLEQMLKSDEIPASAAEQDLVLDLDLEGSGDAGQPAGEQTGSGDAEFLDIEKMLEEGEETAPAAKGAQEPVELDLEAVLDEAAKSAEPELELDLDLGGDDLLGAESELGASESGEADLDFKLLDSDEETLQFGATQASATMIDEGLSAESKSAPGTNDFATDDFTGSSSFGGQTDIMESMGAGAGAPARRRRSGKSLLAVFALLLLCLIGYVVIQNLGVNIPYVSDFKIPYLSEVKIPYLSGMIKTEDQDVAGNLRITPLGMTITHKFVQNNAAGEVFVIQGQVRNEYNQPRSYIKITGKLYVKGNALAKTATVYCGNVLSDSDLENMDMADIDKHLQNRFGDNRSNIRVSTGKTLPFFIVFNKLPPNLDEYTVEVAGSSS